MGKLRVLLPWLALFPLLEAASASSMAKPECVRICGDVEVPYPFGLNSSNCSLGQDFLLRCDESAAPHKLMFGNAPVLNVNVERGELTISFPISYGCYEGGPEMKDDNVFPDLYSLSKPNSTFTFSDKNKLTTIGCDAMGLFLGSWRRSYLTGVLCATSCDDLSILKADSSSCDGVGCCQTVIPKGMTSANININSIGSDLNSSLSASGLNCSYAFLVKEDNFNFQPNSDLVANSSFLRTLTMPVLVDWAIGHEINETCQTSDQKGAGGGVCHAQNSKCITSAAGYGYQCNCNEGFQGNPYLDQGCQDIDECKIGTHNCTKKQKCVNSDGKFYCRTSVPAAYRAVAATVSSLFLLLSVGRLVFRYNLVPKWVMDALKQDSNQKEPDPSSSTGELDMRRNAKEKKRYPVVEGEYLRAAKKCKKKLRTLIYENRCAPIMLCLAWQDVNEKTGKPFRAITHQFADEDINKAVNLLAELKGEHSFNKLSDADIRQLAGVVAVEVAGGPDVAFHPGREDNGAQNMPPRDIGTTDSVVGYLREALIDSSLSLSVHDIVAISPFLRCNRDCSGFQFTWPPTFDNSYFVSDMESLTDDYQQALVGDPEFLVFVEKYANDEASFFADYAKSHMKLSELGFADAD